MANPNGPFRWLNRKNLLLSIFIGLLITGSSVGAILSNRTPAIVRSSASGTYTDPNGLIGSDGWELFPSTSGAAVMFDEQLQTAKDYRDFRPCFDDKGQRIGERAEMWIYSPPPTRASWRIVWTERSKEFSQLYWAEAETLAGARKLESSARQKWKLCRRTK